MFWENTKFAGMGQRSLKRGTAIIGMAPDIQDNEYDQHELDRYGIGHVRNLSLFYQLFLIDTKDRKATQLCPFVKSGIMHRDFQPHLRPDGLGIDYTSLTTYDTRTKIEEQLFKQHPYWIGEIERHITKKNRVALLDDLSNARRIGLDKKHPELIQKAQEAMRSWQT
jgi:hypothetical protein